MSDKVKVAILFGGRSAEHEISLLSAQNIISNIDRKKYEPILIGIDKSGTWYYHDKSMQVIFPEDPKKIKLVETQSKVLLSQNTNEHQLVSSIDQSIIGKVDVIFPVLHGTFGEDGAIQGFARLANIPCVGPGIVGSAVAMDKDMMKKVFIAEKIPTAKFVTIRNTTKNNFNYNDLKEKLGSEMFVKPASLGSSVGVSFVKEEKEFIPAIEHALKFDKKVIVEERIIGREVECSVLGNDNPETSIPGEVVPNGGFYSYENKYVDDKGAVLIIPAELTESEVKSIQKLAIESYIALECRGMSRVDMFLRKDGTLIVNEINTIPGFTKISMYPKLWEHSGTSQKELITKLIQLAIEENESLNQLEYTV